MTRTPLVSAIVLNYRTPDDTLRCTEALRKQTVADDLEIIVVDNDSQDGSLEKLRTLLVGGDRVHVLSMQNNVGYGHGNNAGAERAKGTYLLIVNPDTELLPDTVEKMVRYAESHPDIGIIGPQLIFPNGTIRDSYRTFPTFADIFIKRTPLRFLFPKRMSTYLQWNTSPYEARDVDWVVGACLLIRRDFFNALKGFDPRFFLFFEDTDICKRCWQAGKRVVFFPDAKARDSAHRLSSGGLLSLFFRRTVRIHVLSAWKYFWKWRRE